MGATFSRIKVWVSGEILTASDLNGEIDNLINNLDPAGIDDASADLAAMRAIVDPGEVGSESLATSLEGEIHRIRNIIKEITGEAQWYVTPAADLTALFESGTEMVFFQAAAPTGWTQNTTHTNKGLRVVDGAGGGSGGTLNFDNATVSNHTLTTAQLPSHTHPQRIDTAATGDGSAGATGANSPDDTTAGVTGSTGSGNAHNHGLDLKFIDVIVCARD